MEVCNKPHHVQIIHDEMNCPLCEALEEIDNLESERDDWRDKACDRADDIYELEVKQEEMKERCICGKLAE